MIFLYVIKNKILSDLQEVERSSYESSENKKRGRSCRKCDNRTKDEKDIVRFSGGRRIYSTLGHGSSKHALSKHDPGKLGHF